MVTKVSYIAFANQTGFNETAAHFTATQLIIKMYCYPSFHILSI